MNPKEVLFFTGAGISAPDPCSFPFGKELHFKTPKILNNMMISLAIRENESSPKDEAKSFILKVNKIPNQDKLFRGQILDETSQIIFETNPVDFQTCLNEVAKKIDNLGTVINADTISVT